MMINWFLILFVVEENLSYNFIGNFIPIRCNVAFLTYSHHHRYTYISARHFQLELQSVYRKKQFYCVSKNKHGNSFSAKDNGFQLFNKAKVQKLFWQSRTHLFVIFTVFRSPYFFILLEQSKRHTHFFTL